MVNICFASLCFPQGRWWIYIHLEKDFVRYFYDSTPCFVVWILWPEMQITHRKYGFLITSKMSLMSSGDMQISLWKSQSQNFTDFDIKTILLAQNSFDEWLAFCWVDYCVFQNYIETLKYFVIVTWSWLFQFYSVQFFVMP